MLICFYSSVFYSKNSLRTRKNHEPTDIVDAQGSKVRPHTFSQQEYIWQYEKEDALHNSHKPDLIKWKEEKQKAYTMIC